MSPFEEMGWASVYLEIPKANPEEWKWGGWRRAEISRSYGAWIQQQMQVPPEYLRPHLGFS